MIKKKINIKLSEDKFYLLLLCIVMSIFYLLYFNRFISDLVGWQTFDGLLMREEGKMIYKDFYSYLPPLYTLRCSLLDIIFNGSYLAYRCVCIIERISLAVLQFVILKHFFRPSICWIACCVSGILVCTTNFDTFSDYNQLYKIFLLLAIYFAISFLETVEYQKKYIRLCMCGISLGLIFLTKQSIGLIAPCAFFVTLMIICWVKKERNWWKYSLWSIIGYLFPILITYSWLLANGALIDYFEQVFFKLNSKGSVSHVLFSIWNHIFNFNTVTLFCSLFISLWCFKFQNNKRLIRYVRYLSIAVTIIMITINWGNLIIDITSAAFNTKVIYILEILFICIVILLSSKTLQKFNEMNFIKNALVALSLVFSYYIPILLPSNVISDFFEQSNFSANKTLFPVLAFFFIGALFLFLIGYLLIKRKPYIKFSFLVMVMGIFVGVYESGMTSGDTISYSTVLLSFPLIICLLFNYKVKYMQLKFNLLISIFSIGIMLSMSQKLTTPYTWWGWTDESISEQTNYTINIDELKGFRVDKRTKVILEEVTKLITNNSSSNDFVFTFPHIKFFNILSHRYNMPTFTSNYFFDTCSDYYAIQDYNILKENYPDIIVWCDLGEDCWNIHEDKFRMEIKWVNEKSKIGLKM